MDLAEKPHYDLQSLGESSWPAGFDKRDTIYPCFKARRWSLVISMLTVQSMSRPLSDQGEGDFFPHLFPVFTNAD